MEMSAGGKDEHVAAACHEEMVEHVYVCMADMRGWSCTTSHAACG